MEHAIATAPGASSSVRLALELAMRIKPAGQIAREYGLDPAELKHMLHHDPQLRALYREFRQQWTAPQNAVERIRTKASTMVEDLLPEVWEWANDETFPPPVRLEVVRYLTKLADLEPKPQAGTDAPGARFSLVLNLGDTSTPVTIDAEYAQDQLEDQSSAA